MKILLQHKIFIGYFLLMAIIGSMVAIVLHERNRVQKIENESIAIFQTQYDINTAHRYVTALVTYGESVLVLEPVSDSLTTGISLATARLVGHGIIAHQSSFSLSAVFFTILGFLIIQCVALFILCGKLFKKEVHQLLYGEMAKKQHTGSTHGSLLSLVIGTAVLLVAYWVAIEHFMAGGGVMLLVAVLLGIVGTILFIRGIARLLSIVAASNKRKATNGLYVFTLRQLHENVVYKYISISVASILMMLTIMFIANGSATIMSHGNELTRTSAVYDFTVMGEEQNIEQYLSDEQMRVYVANLNRMETGNMKRPASGEMKSFVDWSVLRKEIVQNLPEGVIDPATQEAASYEFGSHQNCKPLLICYGFIGTGSVATLICSHVSSYNRLLKAAGKNKYLVTKLSQSKYIKSICRFTFVRSSYYT